MGGGGKGVRVGRSDGRLQSVIEDAISISDRKVSPKRCPCELGAIEERRVGTGRGGNARSLYPKTLDRLLASKNLDGQFRIVLARAENQRQLSLLRGCRKRASSPPRPARASSSVRRTFVGTLHRLEAVTGQPRAKERGQGGDGSKYRPESRRRTSKPWILTRREPWRCRSYSSTVHSSNGGSRRVRGSRRRQRQPRWVRSDAG